MPSYSFTDPSSGDELVVHFGATPGIEHPLCAYRGEVFPELNTWFCQYCVRQGWLDGAVFLDRLGEAMADASQEPLPLDLPAPEELRSVEGQAELSIQERFEAFHELNPWVYRALCALARDLKRQGRGRLGIGMLYEVLRWHYWRSTSDPSSDFKLNDHYRSRYARLMMENEPDLDGVFELRGLRSP